MSINITPEEWEWRVASLYRDLCVINGLDPNAPIDPATWQISERRLALAYTSEKPRETRHAHEMIDYSQPTLNAPARISLVALFCPACGHPLREPNPDGDRHYASRNRITEDDDVECSVLDCPCVNFIIERSITDDKAHESHPELEAFVRTIENYNTAVPDTLTLALEEWRKVERRSQTFAQWLSTREYRWVPVAERLPSNNRDVLVVYENRWRALGSYRDGNWCAFNTGYDNNAPVTHWHELPELPL